MDSTKLQSSTIDLLRFPLIIMVIFIHMNPNVTNPSDAHFNLFSGESIYNIICILLSKELSLIAVPTFFLISGFLFFVNFQKWSWGGYKIKMGNRIKSLLIPYLLWNSISFILIIIILLARVILKGLPFDSIQTFLLGINWHIFYDCTEWGAGVNWIGDNLIMVGPYNLPLWFLRDLITVTILTPLIYYAIKKLKFFLIGVLFIAYISRIWIPGFQSTALFFYTMGAYFALNKINIIEFSTKYKLVILPICIVLLVTTTYFYGTYIEQNINPLFVCFGVFSSFYIATICITKYNIKPNKLLVSSCFFIYAFHGVNLPIIGPPIYFIRNVLHEIIPGNLGMEEVFSYIVTPFITAYLCIIVLIIARRIFPKTTLYFSGNK